MSDGEALLVVLAFLYGSDCFAWLRQGSIALCSAWGRRYRVHAGSGVLSNGHGSLLPLNPLPPFGRLYLTHPLPISVSPEGIAAANLHSLAPTGGPGPGVTAFKYEQISAVSSDGSVVWVNNARFARCGTTAQATELAELIRAAKTAKQHKREPLIREFLEQQLSVKEASNRLKAARPHLLHLTILSTAFFLFLFLLLPWMAMRTSASAVLIKGALGAVLLAGTTALVYYRAHARLFPRERFERISSVVKMILCPPMAIQAVNHLTIPLLATFHPVAVISVLKARNAPLFLQSLLRRQKYAVRANMQEPATLAICEWFDELQSELVIRFLKETEPTLLQTAFAPPTKEDNAVTYCPRCLSQYESSTADCPDCPGVKLTPFATTPPS